jgi:hypothetical protein
VGSGKLKTFTANGQLQNGVDQRFGVKEKPPVL